MRRTATLLGWIGLLWASYVGTASADVVFRIENVSVTPGSQAVLGVFVRSTAGETISAYDLPIEIGGNGRGFPANTSFASGDFAQEVNSFDGDVTVTGLESSVLIRNHEAIFSDSGSPISISAERRLFNVLVDTSAGFSGVSPVSITQGAGGLEPNFFNIVASSGTFTATGGGVSVINGSISAVPEPSSFGIVGLLLTGVCVRRRRA